MTKLVNVETGEIVAAQSLLPARGWGMSDTRLEGMLADAARRSSLTLDVDMRAITRDDVVACHKLLDDIGVPRRCDAGEPLSIRWRLTHLAAVTLRTKPVSSYPDPSLTERTPK